MTPGACSRGRRAARSPRRTTAVLLIVLAAVCGCTAVTDGRGVPQRPAVGAGISWFACAAPSPGDPPRPAGTRCGELSVPLDAADPAAGTVGLAVVAIDATGPRMGALVVNPGGPGASGVDFAVALASSLPAPIRARFDLVGFDPRGVGASTPTLRCNSDADNDRQRAEPAVDLSPAGVARIDSDTEAYVARCLARTGATFLAGVGSTAVARDLEALRAALGDERLTYLGYSYGTVLGAAYARTYPHRVRAMVLDGALDVEADPLEAEVRQSAAFQEAFDAFAGRCALRDDCPLGTDRAGAVARYRALVDPLVDRPAATVDPRGLSYDDALGGTVQALYGPRTWPQLTDGLRQLSVGRGDTLLQLADVISGRDPRGHYDNSVDVRIAVRCVDQPRVTDPAVFAEQDRRLREVAPFLHHGTFTGHAARGTCALWPVPRVPPPTATPADLPATLVVASTGDPVTPYAAGVTLAGRLRAALLTVAATAHTAVFQADACVDDVVTRYLVDLAVPAPGARCG